MHFFPYFISFLSPVIPSLHPLSSRSTLSPFSPRKKHRMKITLRIYKVLLFVLFLLVECRGYDLVIYSVDSLFSYPPYNFTQAFEQYAGLAPGIVLFVLIFLPSKLLLLCINFLLNYTKIRL